MLIVGPGVRCRSASQIQLSSIGEYAVDGHGRVLYPQSEATAGCLSIAFRETRIPVLQLYVTSHRDPTAS
jgi:hypothetical protein